jgi:glycine hydroxymethyltransferase
MREIASIIHSVLAAIQPETIAKGPNAGQKSKANFRLDEKVRQAAARRAAELLERFPLYPDIEL